MIRAGRIAGHAVETAVKLALSGEVDAIVTAPAHKHALHLAGFPYPGHTEWLAHLAGDVDVAMMLAAEPPGDPTASTPRRAGHDPRAVPGCAGAAHGRPGGAHRPRRSRALREWWGIERPRLAVCAVNPHAGESGLFGDEEERVLRPAAEELGAAGPLPADTVFVRAHAGRVRRGAGAVSRRGDDGDQGGGVRAGGERDLGLPFPRTSPDHGTALDIAGTGKADASSMRAAIELAVRLAEGGR